MATARTFGDEIPIGVIYRRAHPTFRRQPADDRPPPRWPGTGQTQVLRRVMDSYR
jgi:hypothetical protein